MRYAVRLFGGLADRAGTRCLDVELGAAPTVGRLREAVAEQHPTLAPLLSRVTVTVDLEVAGDQQRIGPASELALLPPVAGGADGPPRTAPGTETARIRDDGRRVLTGLRTDPLDAGAAVAAVAGPEVGGTVTFLGSVRDHAPDLDDRVVQLTYSAYARMAEEVLERLAGEVLGRWPEVRGIALLHAVGELEVGEPTVLVVCASAHRGPAFEACRHALEQLKTRVPVFKHETTETGERRWVGLDDC